jgi:hypothetical protein
MKLESIIVIVFVLALTIPLAFAVDVCSAGTAASVNRAWAGINPADVSGQVSLGAAVNIYWSGVSASADGDTVDITVIDPQGTPAAYWTDVPPNASGTLQFTADKAGSYAVIFDGNPTYRQYSTIVACTSLFVVSEAALGSLTAVLSGIAAVCMVGTVKARKRKAAEADSEKQPLNKPKGLKTFLTPSRH